MLSVVYLSLNLFVFVIASPRFIVEEGGGHELFMQPNSKEFKLNLRKNESLGQVSGIDIDANGDIHVLHRGSRAWNYNTFDHRGNYALAKNRPIKEHTHLVVDKAGNIKHRMHANMFFMPHMLTVDKSNNVWITDVALHQVMKFAPGQEQPSLVLGERFVSGRDNNHFCQPTDVAVAGNGDFFVSDGYCNQRVVKFSADGTYLTEFGANTFNSGGVPFSIPHSLTLVEEMNEICVADRERQRVMCFAAGLLNLPGRNLQVGEPIRTYKYPAGRTYAIANQDRFLFGVQSGNYRNGANGNLYGIDLVSNSPVASIDSGAFNPHDLAISPDGTFYIAEIGPNRITRVNPFKEWHE